MTLLVRGATDAERNPGVLKCIYVKGQGGQKMFSQKIIPLFIYKYSETIEIFIYSMRQSFHNYFPCK